MSTAAKPFEPDAQFRECVTDMELAIVSADLAVKRLQWLAGKIVDDFHEWQKKADQVEIYTEEQAAHLMQIKPSQLAALRRRHRFEHINFGSFVRYNRSQIIAICEFLTLNNKPAAASSKPLSVVRKAA